MFFVTPLVSDAALLARTPAHGSGRIVWQQRYEGIARVAYRGGKAIAGVSGPWSDRYVLIWWDERPVQSNPLELFETAEAAMFAVEKRMGQVMLEIAVPSEPRREPGRSWWAGLWAKRRDRQTAQSRRCHCDAAIDLSGLNFSASR
jgi:hypothetical protein